MELYYYSLRKIWSESIFIAGVIQNAFTNEQIENVNYYQFSN